VNLTLARAVADAVLYEGYLLYPYRASSSKNQSRWQFGVLGPPGAAKAGLGEESSMSMQGVLIDRSDVGGDEAASAHLVLHLRFLQLQRRQLYDQQRRPIEELSTGDSTLISWDEAVEQEVSLSVDLVELALKVTREIAVEGGEESDDVNDSDGARIGVVVRRRWRLSANVEASVVHRPGYATLTVRVENSATETIADKDDATRISLIGAHLLIEAHGTSFVSLLEPPDEAREVVAECGQHRCWPVLVGESGDTDLVLGSPIILYDYPEIASQSAGALFDATEIDEILTLRVMTMTDQEKAEARATDPRAAEIIDRCDQMSDDALQQLHGILRNPHADSAMPEPQWADPPWPELQGPELQGPQASDVRDIAPPSFDSTDVPWWDPAADAAVRPEVDSVTIRGFNVSKGSLVRVHPNRRADAQDLFFAGQVARVSAVLSDVDGGVHVALVLVDDPAADLHEWYGRYLYFDPDELEPLPSAATDNNREESRP